MKSNIYIIAIFIVSMAMSFSSKGQELEVITLEEAIEIGLENNFGIRVARNDATITSINKNIGDVGFLPTIDLNGEYSQANEDWRIEDKEMHNETDGREKSLYKGANLSLNWKVFEGFWKITNYKKLSELEKLGHLQANITIENTVLDITAAYYNIVRHEKRIDVLNNTVEISEDRNQIARAKYELGAGSEYELLVTNTDLNVDQTEVIREKLLLHSAKMEFIQLLDLDTAVEFQVNSDIELKDILVIEDIRERAFEENRQLTAAQLRESVARLEEKSIFNKRLPEVSLGAAYNLNQEDIRDNPLHRVEYNDEYYYGLVAKFNLFDGFKKNRQAQIAKINHENRTYEREQQYKLIETRLSSNYENYRATIALIALEKENLELAKKVLDIAFERFRLANITPVELRESQKTLLDTETRLITAMFEAKIYETELLRLSGKLLEQYNISPL